MKKQFNLSKEKDFFQVICKKEATEVMNDNGDLVGLEIEGYASTKDKDRVNDIVLPEAFEDSMKIYSTNPIVLLQHDKNKPIGKVIDYRIDNQGLWIKARITENVDNVFSAIKNDVLRTFSIGYKLKEFEEREVTARDPDGNDVIIGWEWIITALELFEISVVSVPANPYALMKSFDNCFEKMEVVEEKKEIVEEKKEIVEEAKETEEVVEETPEEVIEEAPAEEKEEVVEEAKEVVEEKKEETPKEVVEEEEDKETETIEEEKAGELANGKVEVTEEVKTETINDENPEVAKEEAKEESTEESKEEVVAEEPTEDGEKGCGCRTPKDIDGDDDDKKEIVAEKKEVTEETVNETEIVDEPEVAKSENPSETDGDGDETGPVEEAKEVKSETKSAIDNEASKEMKQTLDEATKSLVEINSLVAKQAETISENKSLIEAQVKEIEELKKAKDTMLDMSTLIIESMKELNIKVDNIVTKSGHPYIKPKEVLSPFAQAIKVAKKMA